MMTIKSAAELRRKEHKKNTEGVSNSMKIHPLNHASPNFSENRLTDTAQNFMS
jgi:hypothetical protein